jgi:hypothetical protein
MKRRGPPVGAITLLYAWIDVAEDGHETVCRYAGGSRGPMVGARAMMIAVADIAREGRAAGHVVLLKSFRVEKTLYRFVD